MIKTFFLLIYMALMKINLQQKYKSFDNDNIIKCGDWNLVIKPDLDSNNYLYINNPQARQ